MGLHVVEDDENVISMEPQRASGSLVRPVPLRTLVKPTVMQVVRPIPKRATEQYYEEAFKDGLTLKETSEAAALAHDWHRRWTHQDEQNHTTPDANFYTLDLPAQDQAALDRQGARNPSLIASDNSTRSSDVPETVKRALDVCASPYLVDDDDDDDVILFNPEDRLSACSWSESSSLSSHMAPQVKRRFVASSFDAEDAVQPFRPTPILGVHPLAARPRIVRPITIRPVLMEPQSSVPDDIVAMRRHGNVSPMSCSEGSMHFDGPERTNMRPQQEVVHVVEDSPLDSSSTTVEPKLINPLSAISNSARDEVLRALAVTHGDVDSPKFKQSLDPLLRYFSQKELDTRPHVVADNDSVDGTWLTLSKPSFFGCLGENDSGDPMYTLGRMSFDMFSPTNLVCSLQGNFNPVEVVSEEERKKMLECVPKALREEVESGKTVLRTYHVVTAFTIEPASPSFANAPNKDVHRPIKGIMTTFGYSLPDPEVANRHSIWFTGGRIEPNNDAADTSEWLRLFALHPPSHSFGEKAKLLAVKLLMGATTPESLNQDGSMEYTFTRPLGGHGMAYVDVIYLDESLKIVRGHRGTIFVFSRLKQEDNKQDKSLR